MIAPITLREFFEYVGRRANVIEAGNNTTNSQYWEKKPLLVKRHQKNYYKQLLTTEIMDDILHKVSASINGPETLTQLQNYLKFTTNVDVAVYEDGERKTLNPDGRAHAHVVWDFYEVNA